MPAQRRGSGAPPAASFPFIYARGGRAQGEAGTARPPNDEAAGAPRCPVHIHSREEGAGVATRVPALLQFFPLPLYPSPSPSTLSVAIIKM